MSLTLAEDGLQDAVWAGQGTHLSVNVCIWLAYQFALVWGTHGKHRHPGAKQAHASCCTTGGSGGAALVYTVARQCRVGSVAFTCHNSLSKAPRTDLQGLHKCSVYATSRENGRQSLTLECPALSWVWLPLWLFHYSFATCLGPRGGSGLQ